MKADELRLEKQLSPEWGFQHDLLEVGRKDQKYSVC